MQNGNYFPPNRFTQEFARLLLGLSGWKLEGSLPSAPKYVIAVAHHTSNWDFVILLLTKIMLRLRLRFLGKHSLFHPPLGWLMRLWGGVPVKRDKAHNVVTQVISYFNQHEYCALALSPEGTRGPVTRWKMGFYHIAMGAGVPIVPVAINYQSRRIVIGDPVIPCGDEAEDMKKLHTFYLPHPPRFPEHAWHGPFTTKP